MRVKNNLAAVFALSAMLGLIFDSAASVSGCRQGIELCLKSVIPALFPFLVLSPILTNAGFLRLPHWLHRTLKLPEGGDGLWLNGVICGYPMGAQCIAQTVKNRQISENEAERLMSFCCNCGPGFIFGVCSSFFTAKWASWGLWLCHIVGSIIVGWLIPGNREYTRVSAGQRSSFVNAFARALKSMAQICGWVILFRCLLEFLQQWFLWRLGPSLRAIVTGVLELTNGCFALPLIRQEALRFIICEGMVCFGGLCVALQTASVAAKLKLKLYLPGKLLQTVISSILAAVLWGAMHLQWSLVFCATVILLIIMSAAKQFLKNYSRNLSAIGV